ncbi:hypothetical protein MWU52_07835 [Jannaschia sp. S6380]|uniref:T4SS efffector SepA family protein n=1 Tax=Jannaschia sp. S6380 TaxID=2926408 RepID=UPI001FF5483D|nr:hypothetical protein [Jannaschia sp. S6380]MCK0167453.1 hypothetical protein [Jannaschia sp. S6380]
MKAIEVQDRDFARLQALAVPLEDTAASVVTRLLDRFEASTEAADSGAIESVVYGPTDIPPMRHTKLLDGSIENRTPEKMTWDAMIRLAFHAVLERDPSIDNLRKTSGANVVSGRKETEGYKYDQKFDFSYQGVSAEDAVKILVRCVKQLQTIGSIEFEWRQKEDAHKPGQRASLRLA